MLKEREKIFVVWGMDQRKFSRLFKAFGDPTRQRILAYLSRGERTVSEIVEAIGYSQPTISRHLSVLKNAEIVTDERKGRSVYYGLNKEVIRRCCIGFCDCLDITELPAGRQSKKKAGKK